MKKCSLGNLNIIFFFFTSFFKKIFIWVLVQIGFEPNEHKKKIRTKRASRYFINNLRSMKKINKKKSVVQISLNYGI